MSHISVSLPVSVVNEMQQVADLIAALIVKEYTPVIFHPDQVDRETLEQAMKKFKTWPISELIYFNPNPEPSRRSYSAKFWAAQEGNRTTLPEENLKVSLHLGSNSSPTVEAHLASDEKMQPRQVAADVRVIIEEALNLQGKIPWKKEDC